jgi:hypothetical protein
MALVREFQCIKCGAMQSERARERCANPDWHDLPPLEQEVPVLVVQPGTCGRCVCDDMDEPVCSCCHTAPCQVRAA